MITLRRAEERHYDRRRKLEVWLTFPPRDGVEPLAAGFASLEVFKEERLAPGAGMPGPRNHDAEIVTYVRDGTLAFADSVGCTSVVRAGEFERTTACRGTPHSETNASRTDWAHVFQVWLRPAEAEIAPSHEHKRFSAAERRGELCVVASPDARRGSLRLRQDAVIYSALLETGRHVVHELEQGRSAWLHLVRGTIALGDMVLTTGDGAGISAAHAVSFTAREQTEILLVDLG